MWKALHGASSRDHGTLAFFKSKLNRVSVKKDPKKDVNASLEFLMTITKGHIMAAACKILNVDNCTAPLSLPLDPQKTSYSEQLKYISGIASKIVDQYTLVESSITGDTVADEDDHVHNYARVLCHFGSMIMEFVDGWAEGDSERVFRCWRLFLPHFKAYNRTKYSIEALRLQFQISAVLSPQLAHQIMWDRFVNTKGGIGNNIPCDLYNEFVNKTIKQIIANMGSNFTEKSLQRSARAVTTLRNICEKFDLESDVPMGTSAHKTKTDAQDVSKVAAVVMEKKILETEKGRAHKAFPGMKLNPLYNWDVDKTEEWIRAKMKKYAKFKAITAEEDELEEECLSDDDVDED